MTYDVVLSSGYLAFARHAGFLRAVEQAGLAVDGLCGTSSGALVGALWAAGHDADSLTDELFHRRPLSLVRPHLGLWRGLLSLRALVARLRELLPATFAELDHPFAVGVRAPDGSHRLLAAGPLPEAVAASCAIPWLFAPVAVGGVRYQDGGAVDRLGLGPWRALRGPRPTLVHHVERTAGRDVDAPLDGVTLVRTPRSGASFWSLGDVDAQIAEAERLTLAAVAGLA